MYCMYACMCYVHTACMFEYGRLVWILRLIIVTLSSFSLAGNCKFSLSFISILVVFVVFVVKTTGKQILLIFIVNFFVVCFCWLFILCTYIHNKQKCLLTHLKFDWKNVLWWWARYLHVESHLTPIYFAGGDNFNQIIMKSIYAYTNIIYVCMYKYRLYLCISICTRLKKYVSFV